MTATKPSINNLVAWWTLDEESGNDVYESVREGSYTSTGAVVNSNGKINYCRYFDGSSDTINIGDQSWLEVTNITLVFWAKCIDYTRSLNGGIAKGFIFDNGANSSYSIDFHAGDARWTLTNSADNYVRLSASISDNNWHMWTGTFASYEGSKNVYLYKDAVQQDSLTSSLIIDYSKANNNFAIGARDDGSYSFYGYIDEVSVWNSALSVDNLEWLYNNGNGVGYSNMLSNFSQLKNINSVSESNILAINNIDVSDLSSIQEVS